MTATVNTVLKSVLHFTYFAQKLMCELIQSLTIHYIFKMLQKTHIISKHWYEQKLRCLNMMFKGFSVLELEGDVHLVLNKIHTISYHQLDSQFPSLQTAVQR